MSLCYPKKPHWKNFFWSWTSLNELFQGRNNLYFFFICFLISFYSCTRKIIIIDASDLIKNDHWINQDTLQIIVYEKPQQKGIPFKYQRESSCQKARENIKDTFYKLYSGYDINQVDIKVKYTLYTQDGGCGLVVWLVNGSLQDKLLNLRRHGSRWSPKLKKKTF